MGLSFAAQESLFTLLILGATSAIACETAKLFAADKAKLFLVARNADRLEAVAADLCVRGATAVHTFVADLNDFNLHPMILSAATESLGKVDAALIAHGTLPDQRDSERDADKVVAAFRTNAMSVVSLATLLADCFETQRSGTLAVISSVAGDRGRGSNYIYGSAKAAVSTFLSGLRNRLVAAGVAVVTIKPGFVDTPMTAAFPKNALFAPASSVGRGVYLAMLRPRDVAYIPWFWRWIMLVIRMIPESIFKKLKL